MLFAILGMLLAASGNLEAPGTRARGHSHICSHVGRIAEPRADRAADACPCPGVRWRGVFGVAGTSNGWRESGGLQAICRCRGRYSRRICAPVAVANALKCDSREIAELTDTQESAILTHRISSMRTNIDIDDRLMRQAMRSSGARTKRAAVEQGLRLLIRTKGQASIRRLRGKVDWQGDLNASRLERAAK
jgi:Arc/MetJ family transcription regulator